MTLVRMRIAAALAVTLTAGLTAVAAGGPAAGNDTVPVHLYFADPQGCHLSAEKRLLVRHADPVARARGILKALIDGPQSHLTPTLPADSRVRAVFVADTRIAYVDFSSALRENHPGGGQAELLTVYSVVNSLVLNLDDVAAVKLLVDGNECATLAGHVALDNPLNAHMLLIR